MPLIWLVSISTDRDLHISAKQQGTDSPMRNYGDIASPVLARMRSTAFSPRRCTSMARSQPRILLSGSAKNASATV